MPFSVLIDGVPSVGVKSDTTALYLYDDKSDLWSDKYEITFALRRASRRCDPVHFVKGEPV
jgi:hypothetical protein